MNGHVFQKALVFFFNVCVYKKNHALEYIFLEIIHALVRNAYVQKNKIKMTEKFWGKGKTKKGEKERKIEKKKKKQNNLFFGAKETK